MSTREKIDLRDFYVLSGCYFLHTLLSSQHFSKSSLIELLITLHR